MASGDGENVEDRRKMPKTPQALLALCAEHTDPNNPNENASFNSMDPEKKEWLESALKDMSVNPVAEMRKCIECILNNDADAEARLDALDKTVEWCENMDFANDFYKIGGFDIFPRCAEDDDAEVRAQALELVAYLVQNNPYCQKAVLDNNMLPKLLHTLDNDGDMLVKRKALYALSCLVRDNPEALDVFIANDGFSSLMRAMQTGEEKIKIKSAFMISGVSLNSSKCKDILCDIGMIHQLVGHLSEEHSSFHEHVVSALLTIVKDHPRSVQECVQPELGLFTVLKQKQQDLKGNEKFQEEYEYVVELQKLLTQGGESEGDVAR